MLIIVFIKHTHSVFLMSTMYPSTYGSFEFELFQRVFGKRVFSQSSCLLYSGRGLLAERISSSNHGVSVTVAVVVVNITVGG